MIKEIVLSALIFGTFNVAVQAQETTNSGQAVSATTEYAKNPQAVLMNLKEQPEHISSSLNILHAVSEAEYAIVSRAYIRDGDYYYFISSAPETISSSVLIETKEGQYQRSLVLAEDLAKFAAEALDKYSKTYAGTPIESYHQYAQEHMEALKGIHIQNNQVASQHKALFDESKDMERFMLELLTQFVQQDIQAEIKTLDAIGEVYTYMIDEAAANTLLSLAKPLANNNKMLTGFVEQLEKGYVGTLGFSVETGDVALSVATVDGSDIIEFVLGTEESKLRKPDENQIMTADEFTKMVGVDLFQQNIE
ncbi:hypothetical protein JDW15_03145 [Aerococcaceae bacterium zg-ZJ1578]|uniref:hypothetical protein n=1 Tax=Aerococcaceae bacterium zg-252 TaxID=2796928 RepID=UPI001A18C07E|nr:hypothetical protein [Aerococcaceae bacterium zg-1578]